KMALNGIDWIVISAYLLLNLLISLYYRRRSAGSTEEFFVSGRNVSWWLAGTSMVATTFAADTPLLVAGLVAKNGISGNWLWWSQCLCGMMTVFFFARYWRRAEILTDVEFVELRYGGKPAAFLRGFRAIYLGALMNCLILGWVIKAMISIITVLLGDAIAQGRVLQVAVGSHALFHYTLGAPEHTALLICVLILVPFTGLYTFIGGLWGVLVTDLFQFALKMSMIIVLAWIAVARVGGMTLLKIQLSQVDGATRASGQATGSVLSFFPSFHLGWTTDAIWTLPVITFILYLAVQWWASWYPGAEPGGGGYVAQRMFSAKDEKNSLGATLWFNIAHYAMRSWPWIVTGLVAVAVYSPHGGLRPSLEFAAEPEKGYVMVLRDFLPPALRGLMVAAFLAAFMSTVGTQLNWGTSYLLNDFYRRFLVRRASDRHYVIISKLFIVLLVILSGYAAANITSIQSAWQLLLGMGAGTGGVLLLRWYWWRINAWSEISSMSAAFIVSLSLRKLQFSGNSSVVFAKTALITTLTTTIVWLIITLLTQAESEERLLQFYRRVRPTVHGWKHIAVLAPEIQPVRDLGSNTFDWIMGCALVYCCMFSVGELVLQEWLPGFLLLVAAAASGWFIYWSLSRRGWETLSGAEKAPLRTPESQAEFQP
ncbi:MAG TPA: sodium:solute symporter family protein, partial [Candidatus Limnocylindria bacterium]|nr:sodium:solute symporter family protein [Candidatus Limnocylindria bacterium]